MAALSVLGCAAPAAELQGKDWTSAGNLAKTSDRIIRVKFTDSVVVPIEQTDSKTGVISTKQVLFRQFEVLETLKGTIDAEETIWVAFDAGYDSELVNGTNTPMHYWVGPEFVLFLKGRVRPLDYPTDYGPVLWTGNGRPSLSEVRSGRLVFYTTPQYRDSLMADDAGLPDPDSAAPFTLTLAELAALVD
ncbi:MAG: hypothetical protein O2788_01015 [Chloroflexi bacterium]|nr:hypothetical protein [Chloroflexota bacterium]